MKLLLEVKPNILVGTLTIAERNSKFCGDILLPNTKFLDNNRHEHSVFGIGWLFFGKILNLKSILREKNHLHL